MNHAQKSRTHSTYFLALCLWAELWGSEIMKSEVQRLLYPSDCTSNADIYLLSYLPPLNAALIYPDTFLNSGR